MKHFCKFLSLSTDAGKLKLGPRAVMTLGTLGLFAIAISSCANAGVGPSHLASNSPHLASPPSTTPTSTPTSPVTGPPPVSQTTINVTYPSPYNPGYTSMDQLVADSTFIVLGTLGPPTTEPGASGSTITYYPINLQQSFSEVAPRNTLTVGSAEFSAANLSVGGTYVFFWANDQVDKTVCIVGGVRGVMAYNSATDTVTRLDNSANSQIPKSQTLEQFESSVQNALNLLRTQPVQNSSPMCSPSATGLSG